MAQDEKKPGDLGHCLHCDLAKVLNGWKKSSSITPQIMVDTLAEICAQAIVNNAIEGHAQALGKDFVRMLAERILFHEKDTAIDNSTFHAAGHA